VHVVMAGLVAAIHVFEFVCFQDVDARHKAGHDREYQPPFVSGVCGVARGIVLGVAVGGAVVLPVGDVTGERHVAAGDLQELAALGGITQPLGRPEAPPGHSLVFFTRRHGNAPDTMSNLILKMCLCRNCSSAARNFLRARKPPRIRLKTSVLRGLPSRAHGPARRAKAKRRYHGTPTVGKSSGTRPAAVH